MATLGSRKTLAGWWPSGKKRHPAVSSSLLIFIRAVASLSAIVIPDQSVGQIHEPADWVNLAHNQRGTSEIFKELPAGLMNDVLTWGVFLGMVCARAFRCICVLKQCIEREGVAMSGKGVDTRMGRPVKGASDKKRREKVQALRLIGLGVPEATVKKMNPTEVRTMLKRPAKLKK